MENEVDEESSVLAREQRIFAEYPVPKAVATMVVPTIISQIITVIYNLADTWYVGLTGNAAAVAAISLCLPVYNIMTAFGNLFGIGGSSVIARSLGTGRQKRAQAAFSLAVRGAFAASAFYAVLLLIFARPFLLCVGGDVESIEFAVWYTRVTMVIGGIPTILSAVLAHLIRSTGESKAASFGITLGAVLNMVLDPLLMFVLLPEGNEVLGAAIATAISNMAAMMYFVFYILHSQENGIFRFALEKDGEMKGTLLDILQCGIPSFSLLCSIGSYLFAPRLIGFFINDADTIYYGTKFLRILCIAVAIYPLLFVIIAVFQAVGQSVKPFLLSLLHKGSLDIVLFFVIRRLFGLEYILWASPLMAAAALLVGVVQISKLFRTLQLSAG